MRVRASFKAWVAAAAAVVALSFLVAWLFSWPAEKAMFLAPVIVVCFGLLAFLFVLWIRIALLQFRRVRHRRRWIVAAVAFVALVVLLSALGVELPRME